MQSAELTKRGRDSIVQLKTCDMCIYIYIYTWNPKQPFFLADDW